VSRYEIQSKVRKFRRTAVGRIIGLIAESLTEPRYAWQLLADLPRLFLRHMVLGRCLILVYRQSGIGDIVCTFSCLASLRERMPDVLIAYVTRRSHMSLVGHCRYVDFTLEKDSPVAKICARAFRPIRRFCPLLPDELQPPRPRARTHLCDEFFRAFDIHPASYRNDVSLRIATSAFRGVHARLRCEGIHERRLVAIHTGPTWLTKEWLVEEWNSLVRMLTSECNVEVIQIGEDRTAYGEARLAPRVEGARHWLGTLPMAEMLALLSSSILFVGIDSGILHLAGAVGTPCVGIFGPTDPECFLPRNCASIGVTGELTCIGCHHNASGPMHWMTGCPFDIRCMREVKATTVLAACRRLIDTSL
jgi:ADP-heptose:LPS heptosyltransferase